MCLFGDTSSSVLLEFYRNHHFECDVAADVGSMTRAPAVFRVEVVIHLQTDTTITVCGLPYSLDFYENDR